MLQWLLLCFCIPLCNALPIGEEEYFSTFLKNYINQSIPPCDDFFEHVCSIVPNNKLLSTVALNELKDASYRSDEYNFILPKLLQVINLLASNSTYDNITGSANTITKKCQANVVEEGKCRELNKYLQDELFPDERELGERTIEQVAEDIALQFQLLPNIPIPVFHELLVKISQIGNLQAFTRKLAVSAHLRNLFNRVQMRTQKLYAKLKIILQQRIQATPWIEANNMTAYYHQQVNNLKVRLYTKNGILDDLFEHMARDLDRCLLLAPNIDRNRETTICILVSYSKAVFAVQLPLFMQPGLAWNAFNAVTETAVLPPMQLLFVKNEIAVLGSLGFTVSHELSHSIFNNNAQTPIMPKNYDCLLKQRAELCKQSPQECLSQMSTVAEDASDVAGLDVLLQLFEHEKDLLAIDYPDFSGSKEQLLFYSMTIFWCGEREQESDDTHSSNKQRLNAMLMHSEEFHKAFKCSGGDRMYRRSNAFCELLGPDSTKR